MANNLFVFIASLAFVVRGATLATKYAARVAESFSVSSYTVGFIVVAVFSILPEAVVSIDAAISGIPSFGLGVLLGSNVADLTLVFAFVSLLVGRGIKVESNIVKNRFLYPTILLLPLILGLNGHYSRMEGLALVLAGVVFYVVTFRNNRSRVSLRDTRVGRNADVALLGGSVGMLLVGSYFTVSSAVSLATQLNVSPIIIGMLIVGLGTTMPEFFFSLKSVKKHDDSLAIGDVLGTVLADATVLVGTLAIIQPFNFSPSLIYISGTFMVVASCILFWFMKSGRLLTRRESGWLIAMWVVFACSQLIFGVH